MSFIIPYADRSPARLARRAGKASENAALKRGERIAYIAEAPVVHVHRESWSQLTNRYRREAIAHRRIIELGGALTPQDDLDRPTPTVPAA